MRNPTRRGRLLFWGLTPLALVAFGLHVHEVARSGLAQLPVWALRDPDGGYPRVGGYRVETDSSGSGLLPGDRLLSVGTTDLRGAGFIGFDAAALAATGPLGEARLVFERDGVRTEGSIRRARGPIHGLACLRSSPPSCSVRSCSCVRPEVPMRSVSSPPS